MRRAAVLFAVIGLLGVIIKGAKADGTIILNSTQDFQNAINDHSIGGYGSSQNAAAQQSAAGLALSTAFPNDNMVPSTAATTSQIPGMVSFTAPLTSGQNVSGWTYGYHIDPDLTNFTIGLTVYVPKVGVYGQSSGINDITIALTSVTLDSSNQPVYSTRVWGWDGILNPDPTTHLEEFNLAAASGAGAGGSNFFAQDSTFDIRNVMYVSVAYRGSVDGNYPLDPFNHNSLWLGTASLDVINISAVTPEPSSALVLAFGIAGVGLLRTMSRARFRRRK